MRDFSFENSHDLIKYVEEFKNEVTSCNIVYVCNNFFKSLGLVCRLYSCFLIRKAILTYYNFLVYFVLSYCIFVLKCSD
jgi:hypothetical protein